MKRVRNACVLFAVASLLGCEPSSNSTSASVAGGEPTAVSPATLAAAPAGQPRAEIVANDFSSDDYTKGVLTKGGANDQFYFLVAQGSAVPVKPSDVLVFQKSGEAKATKVDSAVQGDRTAVFVTVDRKLDPQGDGFPNKIIVK